MRKTNYHTHTARCMHACGSDEDYVRAAIANGYEVLGFSDHTRGNTRHPLRRTMRMPLSQAEDYLSSIRGLKARYHDQIEILTGLECEYFPAYMDWLLDFVIDHDIDYLMLGHHYYRTDENRDAGTRIYFGGIRTLQELRLYVEDAVAAMETGMYSCFCHPELFMRGIHEVNAEVEEAFRTLCSCALDNGIPLEYNLAGAAYNRAMHVEAYPHHAFWEIAAQMGNTAIIGTDAHDPRALMDDTLREEGLDRLRKLGIQVCDSLPRVDFRAIRKARGTAPAGRTITYQAGHPGHLCPRMSRLFLIDGRWLRCYHKTNLFGRHKRKHWRNDDERTELSI